MRPSTNRRERPASSARDPHDDFGDDLLVGIKAIAAFLNQPERRVQHWADTRVIPLSKTGFLYTGLKSKLRAHFLG
jgi:hypothetical protein